MLITVSDIKRALHTRTLPKAGKGEILRCTLRLKRWVLLCAAHADLSFSLEQTDSMLL